MEIETYEIEETDTITPEIESEAIALIDKLDLKGQKELVQEPKDGERKRFPYPEMTAGDQAIYLTLFPTRTNVNEYSGGILPIRILQVVSHARDFCGLIEVWHKRMRDPDPVLVGHVNNSQYNPGKTFILARWGDGLKPIDKLREEARKALRPKIEAKLREEIAERKTQLESIDSLIERHLAGEYVPVAH